MKIKSWTSLLCIFLITLPSCADKKKDITQGSISTNNVIEITLKPEQNKKIYLSQLIKRIDLKILETTDESLLGDILKLETDGDYFILNSTNKLVYVFDSLGNFKNQIGKKGPGPHDLQHPECFAVDQNRKEILLSNNFQTIQKYNYEGKFLSKQEIDINFKDFSISDKGTTYFHTSKFYNYDSKGNPICSNLWILEKNGNYKTFFPYDPEVYPNGELYFDTNLQFNKTTEGITYNYIFCDTIFLIQNNTIKPLYSINFGTKATTKKLNTIPGQEALEYFVKNPDRAYYIQNTIETKSFLRFNYVMGTQLYDVFYDKKNEKAIEGILVNDIFETHLEIKNHSNNKLIGYIQPFDFKINKEHYHLFDKELLNKLQHLDPESNPILVEFELKDLKE